MSLSRKFLTCAIALTLSLGLIAESSAQCGCNGGAVTSNYYAPAPVANSYYSTPVATPMVSYPSSPTYVESSFATTQDPVFASSNFTTTQIPTFVDSSLPVQASAFVPVTTPMRTFSTSMMVPQNSMFLRRGSPRLLVQCQDPGCYTGCRQCGNSRTYCDQQCCQNNSPGTYPCNPSPLIQWRGGDRVFGF